MRFIGDIHGKNQAYMAIASGCTETVQIGDHGIGFLGEASAEADRIVEEFRRSGNHKFIRGNHDNLSACRTATGWIQDGCYDDRGIMYVGGAWSIDGPDQPWSGRMVGVDWWEDEELSIWHLERVLDKYTELKPRLMVTHDAPHEVAKEMFFGGKYSSRTQYQTKTAGYLQLMFEAHQPEMWIFGHWHMNYNHRKNGTKFHCIDELSYLDVELN